jgi:hypothetical protein
VLGGGGSPGLANTEHTGVRRFFLCAAPRMCVSPVPGAHSAQRVSKAKKQSGLRPATSWHDLLIAGCWLFSAQIANWRLAIAYCGCWLVCVVSADVSWCHQRFWPLGMHMEPPSRTGSARNQAKCHWSANKSRWMCNQNCFFFSSLAKVWSTMNSARYDPRSNLHKHQPVRPARYPACAAVLGALSSSPHRRLDVEVLTPRPTVPQDTAPGPRG